MERIKFLLSASLITIISLLVIYFFYKDFYPGGGIKASIDSKSIEQKSASFLDESGLDYKQLIPVTRLQANDVLIRQVQKKYGLKKSNEILRDNIPGYFWSVGWRRSEGIIVGGSQVRSTEREIYSFTYDTRGHLLSYTRHIPDTVKIKQVTAEEAVVIAQNFVKHYAGVSILHKDSSVNQTKKESSEISFTLGNGGEYQYKNQKKTEKENRTDYQYNYSSFDKITGDSIKISVNIAGSEVSEFQREFIVPQDEFTSEYYGTYQAISKIGFYLIIIITMMITGFRRIRAFEIGFRTAIIMGVIIAFTFALEIYLSLEGAMGLEILIPLILGPILYAGGGLVVWAVGETLTREAWNEKMISLDLATKGYLLHSRTGKSLVSGIAWGTLGAAASILLTGIIASFMSIWFIPDKEMMLFPFGTMSPAVIIFSHHIYSAIFIAALFLLYLVSGLKKRLSVSLLLILSAVLWGVVNAKDMDPLYLSVLIEIFTGFIFVWIFFRYDLLSALVSLTVYSTIFSAAGLFIQPNAFYLQSAYFLAAVIILFFILGVIALFTKDSISDFQNITPVFVKNITERQRLQRELEIARDVQMSFLPRSNPDFKGLEVASKCVPAKEVGGDYYDFVNISPSKSGIIVGDVSGKGTQAAFYMTLTKGFLKAVSKLTESPSEVLCQMNELFYQNVERGTFISMIYGVFDTENKIFRFARGGHNPVIVKGSARGNAEMLNPTGLALGLEKGIIFRKTMQELEVPIVPGEVYVFYTDGFTEAMNKEKDEFGEQRLLSCVEANAECSASEILDKIIEEVKSFMGKTRQHDDMTMVVVKVK